MSVTSSANDAIVNFAALLSGREGLSGVNVFEEPQKPQTLGTEYIVVARKVTIDQDFAGFGALSRDEFFTIDGVIETVLAAAGDEASRDIRARSFALFAEIEAELRDGTIGPTLDGAVLYAQITHAEYEPYADTQKRSGVIRFTVTCRSRLNG